MRCLPLLFAMAAGLAACAAHEPLAVRIYPDRYEAQGVRSELATPVVDEVVRRRPQSVHVLSCANAAPARTLQFMTELQARHKARVEGGWLPAQDCPA